MTVVGQLVGQPAAHGGYWRSERHHGKRSLVAWPPSGPAGAIGAPGCRRGVSAAQAERRAGRSPRMMLLMPGAQGRNPVLRTEEPRCGAREMVLAGAELAAPRQPRQKARRGRSAVERASVPAIFRDGRRRTRSAGSVLTRCSSMAAWQELETAALRGQPAVEERAAVDLQPVQEIAYEQSRRALQPLADRAFRFLQQRLTRHPARQRRCQSRSSAIVSPAVWILRRPGLVESARNLLRHQRSSPLGSFGTSHNNSQSVATSDRMRR